MTTRCSEIHRTVKYVLYLLTYLLTPWCRVLLEKLTGLQLVKKFPAFHGTWNFITALTSVRYFVNCAMLPLETLPAGDPSGGVVYLRIVLPSEESSRMWVFLNMKVLQGGVVSTPSNPQAGGTLLVGCPRQLIQFIRSYLPYRRPSLYPEPEDAPCRSDRDPLHGICAILLILAHYAAGGLLQSASCRYCQLTCYISTPCLVPMTRISSHKESRKCTATFESPVCSYLGAAFSVFKWGGCRTVIRTQSKHLWIYIIILTCSFCCRN